MPRQARKHSESGIQDRDGVVSSIDPRDRDKGPVLLSPLVDRGNDIEFNVID